MTKFKNLLTALIFVTLLSTTAFAEVTAYTWTWTSDASGDVSASAGSVAEGVIQTLGPGIIVGARFIPISGISDLYDVTLTDKNGLDLLYGGGANRSSTATTSTNYICPVTGSDSYIPVYYETVTITVANAGNAQSGIVILYVAR